MKTKLKVRLVKIIGAQQELHIEGGQNLELIRKMGVTAHELFDSKDSYTIESARKKYKKLCEGKAISIGCRPIYDTETGELEPGCMYLNDWLPEDFYWDNHSGPYLMVVLPDGSHWNIDSRASNCTMKNDRSHRCWVRHGTPPLITVNKKGHTCKAGAGSIKMKSWHGFLRNGFLVN